MSAISISSYSHAIYLAALRHLAARAAARRAPAPRTPSPAQAQARARARRVMLRASGWYQAIVARDPGLRSREQWALCIRASWAEDRERAQAQALSVDNLRRALDGDPAAQDAVLPVIRNVSRGIRRRAAREQEARIAAAAPEEQTRIAAAGTYASWIGDKIPWAEAIEDYLIPEAWTCLPSALACVEARPDLEHPALRAVVAAVRHASQRINRELHPNMGSRRSPEERALLELRACGPRPGPDPEEAAVIRDLIERALDAPEARRIALDAIYDVPQAATGQALGWTQSKVSRELSRIRAALADAGLDPRRIMHDGHTPAPAPAPEEPAPAPGGAPDNWAWFTDAPAPAPIPHTDPRPQAPSIAPEKIREYIARLRAARR